MTSAFSFVLVIVIAATMLLLAQAGDEQVDFEYSNEYDDVRPHLIYPDEPRLDKRLGQAAKEFGQQMKNAWESMVDSFHNYFNELKNLFTTDGNDQPYGYGDINNGDAEVFSTNN
ncbi:uncharacterized protein [Drosophila tropicalis]|uniref:uncharacterized protein n=1 Tax=Drosophila tropicalis TaxID=46794 RepID=UPI0035AB884B